MQTGEKKKFSLAIGTGFYQATAYSIYLISLINSLKVLTELGIEYDVYEISQDSYVCRMKNSLVHRFLKSDHSHLMIIDSDEGWDVEGFGRLLKASMAGCEVVAGLYPCKNNWEFYGGIPNKTEDGYLMGKEIGDMRLLDMWCVPGGFVIYSREAFERMRPNLDYYVDPETKEEILEVFHTGIEFNDIKPVTREELEGMDKDELVKQVLMRQRGGRRGGRVGEDVWSQLRYKESGGIIWCEPNINMRHLGLKVYEGNYHNYLLCQKAENEVAAALGATEADTADMLKELAAE